MQAVQVGKFWSMAGGHAFVVLFISSAVTALYAHVTCHTMSRPDDYLIRAEAKYISVLLSAFFLLGGPSCICLLAIPIFVCNVELLPFSCSLR